MSEFDMAQEPEASEARHGAPSPSLARYWSTFDVTTAPFVHAGDRRLIESRGVRDFRFGSLDEFVRSEAFGRPGGGLHLGLLPMPFVGNLATADVFVLLLNPGFETADYVADTDPDLHAAEVRTLYQTLDDVEFPFIFLDPRFCWSGGYRWWESKLRDVTRQFALDHGIRYYEALSRVASRVAAIEVFPYHSSSGPAGLERLPSSAAAREFVRDNLVPRARDGELTLIVTRAAAAWGLSIADDDGQNIVVYSGAETRAAYLTSLSRGGAAIAARLRVVRAVS